MSGLLSFPKMLQNVQREPGIEPATFRLSWLIYLLIHSKPLSYYTRIMRPLFPNLVSFFKINSICTNVPLQHAWVQPETGEERDSNGTGTGLSGWSHSNEGPKNYDSGSYRGLRMFDVCLLTSACMDTGGYEWFQICSMQRCAFATYVCFPFRYSNWMALMSPTLIS